MKIIVFDTETTGFPTEEEPQAIVELGWCPVQIFGGGEIEVGDPVSMLVNPGRPIPPEASAVHHIIDEDVVGAPPRDIASRALMETAPDYFAAFNLDFDKQFFGGGGVPMFCLYKAAVRVWEDAPSHSNSFLRYWLGIELDRAKAEPPHRAGADAYVSAHILRELLRSGAVDIEKMLHWSKGPALLPRVNFGKHKGSKWSDLPTDYLEWIRDKSDMDRDVKANAKHWLKLRKTA